jgi:hypothetical protein
MAGVDITKSRSFLIVVAPEETGKALVPGLFTEQPIETRRRFLVFRGRTRPINDMEAVAGKQPNMTRISIVSATLRIWFQPPVPAGFSVAAFLDNSDNIGICTAASIARNLDSTAFGRHQRSVDRLEI